MTKNKKGSSNPPPSITKHVIEGKEKNSSSKNKKGSSNPPLSVTKHVIEGKEKDSSSAAKKIGNEIDEIFADKKRKSVANKKSDKPKAVTPAVAVVPDKTVKKQKKMREEGDTRRGNSSEQQVSRSKKRKTGDGLVIYTEEELGVGKADAGGTRLCPFDCDCCF